jgi:hypothetical protein
MTQELIQITDELVGQINARQEIIEKAKTGIMQNCMDSANAIREAGVYLIELKEKTPHGAWLGLFATALGESNLKHVLSFDYNTGRNYMRFAKANPEPFTDPQKAIGAYREIYRTSGLIEAGESTANANRVTPVDGWLSKLLDAVSDINRVMDKHAIADAPQTIKETFVERARPVVRLFFDAGGVL